MSADVNVPVPEKSRWQQHYQKSV